MNKERYNQIVDEAYENYSKEYEKDNSIGILLLVKRVCNKLVYKKLDKESFTGLCEHDKSFSERWGLKIEERGLTYKERWFLKYNETFEEWADKNWKNGDLIIPRCSLEDEWTEQGIPTKLITVTYNNETIEVYE